MLHNAMINNLYLQDQEGAGGQGEEESKACRDETKDMRLRNDFSKHDFFHRIQSKEDLKVVIN